MEIQVITLAVSNLERSRQFYENFLGFAPDAYYAPTRWQSYKFNGNAFFAIGEIPGTKHSESPYGTDFYVADVEALWDRVCDHAEVKEALANTPWGSFKFVVRDPDGYCLGFVQKRFY